MGARVAGGFHSGGRANGRPYGDDTIRLYGVSRLVERPYDGTETEKTPPGR